MRKRKISPRVENAITFLHPTSDNWGGNFPGNKVEVSVYVYYNPDKVARVPSGTIRISIIAMDDTGMKKDIPVLESEYDAKVEEIRRWCRGELPKPLTKEWLRSQGFEEW